MGEAEFREQLGPDGGRVEGREYVPPAPEPEPEPRPEPLPDAEFWAKLHQIVRDSERGPEPVRGRSREPDVYAEIHEDLAAIGDGIRELSDRMDAEDARRAEAQQEMLSEPAAWQQPEAQAQAGSSLLATREAVADAGEAAADIDMEAEI